MTFEWFNMSLLLPVMLICWLVWNDTWHLRGRRMQVAAMVIAHNPTYENGAPTYVARLSYVDHMGSTHEFDYPQTHHNKKPERGASVGVTYPTGQPNRGRLTDQIVGQGSRPASGLVVYVVAAIWLILMIARNLGFEMK
jgi:hypothetical protein